MLAARRFEIPHRALHVGVAEPLLNRAQIDTSPQAPRSERGAELMEPEAIRVELRPFRYRFQAVEKIELRSASRSRKHETAVLRRLRLPGLQALRELRGNWNLALFICLRCPSPVRFVTYLDGGRSEVHIRPIREHHLLLPFAGHQKELVPQPLLWITRRKQLVEFFVLVDLRLLFGVAGPIVLAHQAANPLRLDRKSVV